VKSFRVHITEYFFRGANPTVDLVVFREGANGKELLLIKRKTGSVEGGKWAIPGGFINTTAQRGEEWKGGAESPLQAAVRELEEETGLRLTPAQQRMIKHIGVFEGGGRDPRDSAESWSRSHAFTVTLPKGFNPRVRGADDASAAEWFPVNKMPQLAFDHSEIVKRARKIA
jgi:8-oxo-dGTP diphosphatase